MAKKVIIGLLVLVVFGGGAYLTLHKTPKKATTTDSSQSSNGSTTDGTENVTANITYSDSGFSPSTVTVKSGDSVAITNRSSQGLQLDSNPHPVHTDDTDLNVGDVTPGQTVIFKVTKKGTFGYHNHLNPSDKGTIVIE